MNYKILIADDEEHIIASYKSKFEKHLDIKPTFTQNAEEALKIFKKSPNDFAVVLLDFKFDGQKLNGAELAEKILSINPKQLIIICSGVGTQETVIKSFKAGALDFIRKGGDVDEIINEVRSYFKKFDETRRVINHNNSYKATLLENSSLIRKIGMVGQSSEMAEVASSVLRYEANKSQENVLIQGESGTGKELVAKSLHKLSSRKDKQFLAINCGALNSNLLESELFGHKKGAFTGANTDKIGKLKICSGGTVFLDEIGDMSRDLQVKLLRFLQEGEITPVGANQPIRVHVRVVAATHVDIEKAIEEGRFREDLFYRLNVIRINLAPLRLRVEDIEPLILYFMEKHPQGENKKILSKAVQYLKAYEWKGNVRELENTVKRLLSNSVSDEITVDDLENKFFDSDPYGLNDFSCDYPAMKKKIEEQSERMERDYILSKIRGSQSIREAANKVSMAKSTLQRKLDGWGFDLSGVL